MMLLTLHTTHSAAATASAHAADCRNILSASIKSESLNRSEFEGPALAGKLWRSMGGFGGPRSAPSWLRAPGEDADRLITVTGDDAGDIPSGGVANFNLLPGRREIGLLWTGGKNESNICVGDACEMLVAMVML